MKNEWINKETEIPPFIDVVPYCFKKENKEVMDFLKRQTLLSDNRDNIVTKEKLQNLLSRDSEFAHLMIPTCKIKTFEDLIYYIGTYDKVVLKPGRGLRGKNIYILEKMGENSFKIGFKKNQWNVNLNSLKDFFEDAIKGNYYILQKYVTSRTPQGDPFDCRVHVEKSSSGEWSVAKIYVRIGIGQSVISNVNQGGGISDPKEFLKANFENDWKGIYNNLSSLGKKIAKKMESLRGTHIMSLGMDIGIDENGKLYLFEVNDGPSTKALIHEVAFHRSNYYLYILKNKFNYSVIEPVNMIEAKQTEINELKHEVKQLKEIVLKKEKKLNQILNSRSWKLTGFLRKTKKFMTKG
ncbi:YheC/YheD family protein [Oceanobacillus locisalsi]|uniref:YheC/YheD family protein n=1 Tax=Oceanobacillus locisalsi TaxID=546107 RepID=A0ABW3NAR9_9BACI